MGPRRAAVALGLALVVAPLLGAPGDARARGVAGFEPALAFATYLGGAASNDEIRGVAVDAAGAVYVTGATSSPDFPAGGVHPSGGAPDAFVAKFASDGGGLVYATVLGGSGADAGYGIAVDAAGVAFVTGRTESIDFPTTVGPAAGGGPDAFVASLDADGVVRFARRLGGSDADVAYAIALDSTGRPVVVGETESADFPVRGGLRDARLNTVSDAFVARVSSDGAELERSARFGGSSGDAAYGVAVDAHGAVYVVGYTSSYDFPTTAAAFEREAPVCSPRASGCWNAFATRLEPSGAVGYSTFLGGGDDDVASAVAVDGAGAATVVGWTASDDFPTRSAIQPKRAGGVDGFVVTLDPSGASERSATYLGGAGDDALLGVAVDRSGRVCLAGVSAASDFPTARPLQGVIGGLDASSGVVAVLDATGASLLFATPFTGSRGSAVTCAAVGPNGQAIVAGVSASSDLSTRRAAFGFPGDATGTANGFVAGFADLAEAVSSPNVAKVRFRRNASKGPRIVVEGRDLAPGLQVFVGDADAPWRSLRQVGSTIAVLENADELVAVLPKGSRTRIRCVNADGGEFTAYVRMR